MRATDLDLQCASIAEKMKDASTAKLRFEDTTSDLVRTIQEYNENMQVAAVEALGDRLFCHLCNEIVDPAKDEVLYIGYKPLEIMEERTIALCRTCGIDAHEVLLNARALGNERPSDYERSECIPPEVIEQLDLPPYITVETSPAPSGYNAIIVVMGSKKGNRSRSSLLPKVDL